MNLETELKEYKSKKKTEDKIKKFIFTESNLDTEIIQETLQKDLTDYQEYVKEQISQKEPVIQEIIKELQSVVNEVSPNYKVNLYGSYCTGLCLPWSDIDTVITCESGQTDEYFLNRLYYNYLFFN